MRTVISIGKRWLAGLALAASFGATGSVHADPVVRQYDFEGTALGEFPKGVFSGRWGGPGKGGFVYVTNNRAATGERSLVVNQLPRAEMFGMGVALSAKRERGTVVVSFDYCREKFGAMTFEFRSPEGTWPFFSFGEKLVLKKKNYIFIGAYGAFKPYTWYHVTFTYPLTAADGEKATIEVKDVKTGESFGGAWDDWLMKDPTKPSSLWFNFHNNTPSHRVMYFDNLTVSVTP